MRAAAGSCDYARMHSADAAFSQVDSRAGHAVKNCCNQVLMLRKLVQVFALRHERGIDAFSRYF